MGTSFSGGVTGTSASLFGWVTGGSRPWVEFRSRLSPVSTDVGGSFSLNSLSLVVVSSLYTRSFQQSCRSTSSFSVEWVRDFKEGSPSPPLVRRLPSRAPIPGGDALLTSES